MELRYYEDKLKKLEGPSILKKRQDVRKGRNQARQLQLQAEAGEIFDHVYQVLSPASRLFSSPNRLVPTHVPSA